MKGNRRRHHGSNDSFDLFLDTITNTFGGVLLLALLLVLMIRETAEVETELDKGVSRSELEEQIEQRSLEKFNLASAAKIRENLFGDLDSTEASNTVDEIAEMTVQNSQLETEKANLEKKLKAIQQQSKTVDAEMAQLESSVAEKQSEIEIITNQLGEIEQKQTRTIPTPRERLSSSTRTFVLVKHNRLFFVGNDSHFTSATKRDADLGDVEDDSKNIEYWKVVRSRGIPVEPAVLEQEFRKLGDDHFVWFAVWPDSFKSFHTIRSACVKAGINHKPDFPDSNGQVLLVPNSGPIKIQ